MLGARATRCLEIGVLLLVSLFCRPTWAEQEMISVRHPVDILGVSARIHYWYPTECDVVVWLHNNSEAPVGLKGVWLDTLCVPVLGRVNEPVESGVSKELEFADPSPLSGQEPLLPMRPLIQAKVPCPQVFAFMRPLKVPPKGDAELTVRTVACDPSKDLPTQVSIVMDTGEKVSYAIPARQEYLRISKMYVLPSTATLWVCLHNECSTAITIKEAWTGGKPAMTQTPCLPLVIPAKEKRFVAIRGSEVREGDYTMVAFKTSPDGYKVWAVARLGQHYFPVLMEDDQTCLDMVDGTTRYPLTRGLECPTHCCPTYFDAANKIMLAQYEAAERGLDRITYIHTCRSSIVSGLGCFSLMADIVRFNVFTMRLPNSEKSQFRSSMQWLAYVGKVQNEPCPVHAIIDSAGFIPHPDRETLRDAVFEVLSMGVSGIVYRGDFEDEVIRKVDLELGALRPFLILAEPVDFIREAPVKAGVDIRAMLLADYGVLLFVFPKEKKGEPDMLVDALDLSGCSWLHLSTGFYIGMDGKAMPLSLELTETGLIRLTGLNQVPVAAILLNDRGVDYLRSSCVGVPSRSEGK